MVVCTRVAYCTRLGLLHGITECVSCLARYSWKGAERKATSDSRLGCWFSVHHIVREFVFLLLFMMHSRRSATYVMLMIL